MKINPAAGFQQYQTYVKSLKNEDPSVAKSLQVGQFPAAESGNTDKVTISGKAAFRAELGRVATALSTEVDSLGKSERIQALRQQVQNGSYHVSSDDLADAILGIKA